MYVPVPAGGGVPAPADHDHRDLLTAIRLLSGYECRRDADQAQVLLVGLTESRHEDVREDARAIMKSGLSRGWFEATAPRYSELERLAERSIAAFRSSGSGAARKKEITILLAGGLAMLVGLATFFLVEGGSVRLDGSIWMLLTGVLLMVLLIFAVALKSRQS